MMMVCAHADDDVFLETLMHVTMMMMMFMMMMLMMMMLMLMMLMMTSSSSSYAACSSDVGTSYHRDAEVPKLSDCPPANRECELGSDCRETGYFDLADAIIIASICEATVRGTHSSNDDADDDDADADDIDGHDADDELLARQQGT